MAQPDDLQSTRDVRRALTLISRLRGLGADASAAVLHDHAVLTGVSVHDAALAVLAEWRPAKAPHRRVPAAASYTAADSSGRIVLRWQGRNSAQLSISGLLTSDLASRLHRAVERALRAGATHLIIDTRATTGFAPEFNEVISWAGRRLWARQGSLTLRVPKCGDASPGRA
jgi:hypothetical protein